MSWKRITLDHTTMVGTYRIVRLPGTTKQDFIKTLTEEVLGMVSRPGLQRETNVVSQDLLTEETEDNVDTCLWAMYFNGIHAPSAVQNDCEAMFNSIKEKLESVGTRVSFSLATLQGRWEAE
jgi:hypothetical protein